MSNENQFFSGSCSQTNWQELDESNLELVPLEISSRKPAKNKIDMTPMVDVTFLLLIFFMITTSMIVVRGIEQPTSTQEGIVFADDPVRDHFIEVLVDQNDSFHITSSTWIDEEAGGVLEMQRLLREAVEKESPERLVVVTHKESSLKRLVAVYSAGRVLGIDCIEMKTTEIDY